MRAREAASELGTRGQIYAERVTTYCNAFLRGPGQRIRDLRNLKARAGYERLQGYRR